MTRHFLKHRFRKTSTYAMLICLIIPFFSVTQAFAQDQTDDTTPQTNTANTNSVTSISKSDNLQIPQSSVGSESNPETTTAKSNSSQASLPATDLTQVAPYSETLAEQTQEATLQTTSTAIIIPDATLKQAILRKLGLSNDAELTQDDMDKLKYLDITSTDLYSLEGIQYAKNLETIAISGTTKLTDFSPLEQLTNLTSVSFQTGAFDGENFPNLEANHKLTNLSIGKNTLIDNSVLNKINRISSLQFLNIDQNIKITTIAPLKSLPNLLTLHVQFCGVTDFTVISQFPVLNNLAAFGQNTGRSDSATTVTRSALNYNEANQTIYIPFSMMPNRMTNFDGYVPPFVTSNSQNQTYFDLNGEQLASERLQIDAAGITIKDVTPDEYSGITSFTYNARLDNPAGSYAKPEGFNFYAISAGTYLHQFNVADDGQPVTVYYQDQNGNPLAPNDVLKGYVGLTYQTKQLEIDGYTLETVQGNTTGKFSDQAQTVIYTYLKNPVQGADITIKYQDASGNDLSASVIKSGNIGDPYTATSIDITGYILKTRPENETGYFTSQHQTITYIYDKVKLPTDKNNTTSTPINPDAAQLPQTGEKTSVSKIAVGIGFLILGVVFLTNFFKSKKYKRH